MEPEPLTITTYELGLTVLAVTIALTISFAVTLKISRIISSRRSAKTGAGATINQPTVDTGGGDNQSAQTGDGSPTYQAGRDLIITSTPTHPPSDPEEPAELSPEEHELLSLIEPGGYFSLGKALVPSITYHYPDRRSKEFKNLRDPSFATARIEALQSLVKRGLIGQRGPKYTLTYPGVEFKNSLLLPSE